MVSPRNRTKPSDDVPNNVVVLVDDDEDDVAAPEPTRVAHPAQDSPATGDDSSGAGAAVNRQLYIWHQIAAHMRRERMLACQLRANAPSMMTSPPQYYTNNNIDPMIQFQAEVLQKQYLLHAHFYHQNRPDFIGNNNNSNRTGNRPVLGVNPGSRVIRKPSLGGSTAAASARLQSGYMHGGGAMARPDPPFVAATTGARVMNDSGQIGLGLGLGVGVGEIEPEGIDLTLKL